MKAPACLVMILCCVAAEIAVFGAGARQIPAPLAGHPGNVFVAGERVAVDVPGTRAGEWRLLDYEEKEVAVNREQGGRLELGMLPTGFYRVQREGDSNWVSLAVLAPLKAATPSNSPIALDVATAWFYPKERMAAAASLCALAGANWVRDRLSWGEMEPKQGEYAGHTRYDDSAALQAQAGLRVLQVNHSSPRWATAAPKRFPPDLRDAYRFYREMARRWNGAVEAFEPWNEADITVFGGHTGSEMASLQKASYLGLKAGNPKGVACLNVFASHNKSQLTDLHDNEAWPYFETFNLHHYSPLDEYPRIYADFRAVSAGRPMWVTEFALPVKWAGDAKLQEPTLADSRMLSERVVKAFACSLHEGSAASFYFLLPHYVEGQTQFGVLRRDLTPRPGFVALAAAGRILAEARPLGRLRATPDTIRAYLFEASPDGAVREVVVAWTTKGTATLDLPVEPVAEMDHLGRSLAVTKSPQLSSAPLFLILPTGSARHLALEQPPAAPPRLLATPSPVVLQAAWPESKTALSQSAYRISSETAEGLPLFVYNLSDAPARGTLEVTAPNGWQAGALGKVDLAPQSRTELRLTLDCREARASKLVSTVRVTGDFGAAGRPVLSLRLMPEPSLLSRSPGLSVIGSTNLARWQRMISGEGKMTISSENGAIVVEAEPRGADRWVYPRLELAPIGRPPTAAIGLGCILDPIEGEAGFQAILDEENGSSYVVDFVSQPKAGQTALALFETARHGDGWSKPDDNGKLDPNRVIAVKIGCNTKADRVRFSIKNLRWIMQGGE